MHIHHLALRDFRNYEHLELSLKPGLTAFVGLNGQGKTNLLEAVHFLSASKSHRTHLDRELIRWEQDFLCTRAEFSNGVSDHNVAELVVTRQGEKRAKLNGAECRQLAEWLGGLNLEAFFPEDLALVSGQPSVRRQFLDIELSRLDARYRDHWLQYRRILSQRNALLRRLRYEGRATSSLPELGQQLARHGGELIVRRHEYLATLSGKAAGIHRRLSREAEALAMRYESTLREAPLGDLEAVRGALSHQLTAMVTQEIERGATQYGPHRDDIALQLHQRDLRRFASQGQRRSAALAMKIAAAEVARERLSEAPILLLDDALSELDGERRFELLELASELDQVLLTTTDSELDRLEGLCRAAVYRVSSGTVRSA